jgi:uncharacterized protein YbjT (DUF2867 family)
MALVAVKLCKAQRICSFYSLERVPILTVLMRPMVRMRTFATMKTAAVVGATGLVGKALVAALERDPDYAAIHVLVRRTTATIGPKTVEHVVDFDDVNSFPGDFTPDSVFCCLGTTIKKAGSQQAFERVDLNYVVRSAAHFQRLGARHFTVVSAVGADADSRIFYSKVKGRMEAAVRALNYPALTIVRPSLLGGKRDEFRFGERMSMAVFAALQWAFVGRLRRYRIHALTATG